MRKPKSPKYRNLTARGDAIYYARVVGGKRIRFSCESSDWDAAARVRDLYESKKGIGRVPVPVLEPAPRFRELAARYLEQARHHLAASTLEDRGLLLGEKGRLVAYFGEHRVDAITRGDLLTWWEAEVDGAGKSTRTGLNYLNALAGVFGLAEDLDHIQANPVKAFRGTLMRRRRTKRGRQEADAADKRNPIASEKGVRAFVGASEAAARLARGGGRRLMARAAGHVADMLMLDAGLRPGEVAGLRWAHIHYGAIPSDSSRRIEVVESIARGRYPGATKSGRSREVPLSRRLRRALREWWLASGRPEGDVRMIPGFRAVNYQRRHLVPVLEAAGLTGGHHTPKSLRHTFATWLLSSGVPIAQVGDLLGHADGGITAAKHYAKWVPRDAVPSPALEPGEVVTDLLARLGATREPATAEHPAA